MEKYALSLVEQIRNTWNGAYATQAGLLDLPETSFEDVPIFFTGLLRYPHSGIKGLRLSLKKKLPKLRSLFEENPENCEFDALYMALESF